MMSTQKNNLEISDKSFLNILTINSFKRFLKEANIGWNLFYINVFDRTSY
jgi:hypothetical protein